MTVNETPLRRPPAFYLTLVLFLLGCGTASAASWSHDGRQLAYSFIGGPENVYLVGVDGAGNTPLVVREVRDFRPEWAPDDSHLVFTGVVDGVHVIMRVNRDGSDLRQLSATAEAAGDPDYSPDGGRLVYFTDEPLPRDLYVKDLASGEVRALTETPDFEEASPRWAPDGHRVVFVGTEPGEGQEGDIWTLDTQTGERRNRTSSPEVGEFHPDWSPDGAHLIYVRVEDGEFAIATRALASGKETLIAPGNGFAVLDPHFAPDGASVTFTRTDFAEKGPGMPAIVRVVLDSGEEATIVRGRYLSEIAADPR